MGGDGSYTSDQLEHALDISVAVLERHRIPHALGFGTLLGYVRDGRMIDGDDDVDIFVETKDFSNAVLAMKSHFPEKVSLMESPYFRCFMVQGVQVDLYSVLSKKENCFCLLGGRSVFVQRNVSLSKTRKVHASQPPRKRPCDHVREGLEDTAGRKVRVPC